MRIAVVTEVSTAAKNADVLRALSSTGHEIVNLGMTGKEDAVELTYVDTSFMSALVLGLGLADFAVGGCGTGQGYLNAVLKYPGIVAGLILDPTDAWLFSQINAGNCVSLALNKGYGWAGDIALSYIFEKLFKDPSGGGYPEARKESQKASREMLKRIDEATHKPFIDILGALDRRVMENSFADRKFREFVKANIPAGGVNDFLLGAGVL